MNLANLRRVQELPGPNRPFVRLADWLADGNYTAAAIDAPFSMPGLFFENGFVDYPDLPARINSLPSSNGRDFPDGKSFVACVAACAPIPCSKPLRVTERHWRRGGLNIRSTLWAGPRPGAPFAGACIKLLAQANRPIWPWAGSRDEPLIVEAFPAGQLRHWGLPFSNYNGPGGQANRTVIVSDLTANRGLRAAGADLATIRENADALDAVLCSYAARAVIRDRLGVPLPESGVWHREGWIAVHD